MTKTLENPDLLGLPEHPQKECDVCGHAPLAAPWLRGFGCGHCRGDEAVIRATELSWGAKPKEPLS